MVTIKFRGLKQLDVIRDELGDECEITFSKDVDVSEATIKKWIVPKKDLGSFTPVRQSRGPDYGIAEIMKIGYEQWPHLKGVRTIATGKSTSSLVPH